MSQTESLLNIRLLPLDRFFSLFVLTGVFSYPVMRMQRLTLTLENNNFKQNFAIL
ncbi:hypothetical protein BJX99DRAFT_218208 [Aspergillus californicus]